MIWGVGTGRCGTMSLAKQLGGVHEPGGLGRVMPWMRYGLACDWESLSLDLLERSEREVPVIVDPRHSYVIPLIREVDPDAQFVWIYRDPVECIESWLARGNWRDGSDDAGTRYSPEGGYPKVWWRFEKGIWFWREVNSRIRRDLMERFQVVKCPDDLEEHENANPVGAKVRLSPEEVELVRLDTKWLLGDLDALRERTRGAVL